MKNDASRVLENNPARSCRSCCGPRSKQHGSTCGYEINIIERGILMTFSPDSRIYSEREQNAHSLGVAHVCCIVQGRTAFTALQERYVAEKTRTNTGNTLCASVYSNAPLEKQSKQCLSMKEARCVHHCGAKVDSVYWISANYENTWKFKLILRKC